MIITSQVNSFASTHFDLRLSGFLLVQIRALVGVLVLKITTAEASDSVL